MQTLSEACSLERIHDEHFRAQLLPEWGQGRAAFGGILAAYGLMPLPASEQVRSVTTTFLAPCPPGPVDIQVRLLRRGRAMIQREVRIFSGDNLCVVMVVASGMARPTEIRVMPSEVPSSQPDDVPPLPFLEGIIPTFTQHFDYRWASGGSPFSGQERAEFSGWIRARGSAPLHTATLMALLDAWPAPVLVLLDHPAPASTVTWLANLTPAAHAFDPTSWHFYTSQTTSAGDGYADILGKLWHPDGRLLATSTQLVAEFSQSG